MGVRQGEWEENAYLNNVYDMLLPKMVTELLNQSCFPFFSFFLFSHRIVSEFCWELQHEIRRRDRWTAVYNEGSFIPSGCWWYNHTAMQSEKFRNIHSALASRCSCIDCCKFNGQQGYAFKNGRWFQFANIRR